MDNWKIQFMVVTFVAFLQTYEAASSAVAEERWLPEHWQVKSLFFFKSQRMKCKNISLD